MATGSEVQLAVKACDLLAAQGVKARAVSMMSFEVFEEQDEAYKESVLPKAIRKRVAVEAACDFGWHKYVGLDGKVIAMEDYGASAPADQLFTKFGFTAEHVAETAMALVKE